MFHVAAVPSAQLRILSSLPVGAQDIVADTHLWLQAQSHTPLQRIPRRQRDPLQFQQAGARSHIG